MNKLLILTLLLILSFNSISAFTTLDTMGEFIQNENITLCQICNDATYIKYSIRNPTGNIIVENQDFSDMGSGLFCIDFDDTEDIGKYDIFGTSDGCTFNYASDFYIKKDVSNMLDFDFNNEIYILIYFFFLVLGLVIFFLAGDSFQLIGAFLVLALGVIGLFNGLNIFLSLVITIIGVIMTFLRAS